MNQDVIIIGASGHGKVVADIVRSNGDKVLGFLDDDLSKECLGTIDEHKNYPNALFIIAIGNSEYRREISQKIQCKWYTAIHPSAVVSPSALVGEGTVVMPNAVINANAIIGRHCIINTSSVVEHDNIIGAFSHISVGSKLGGGVSIGCFTWIGIGAVISNNITICDNCIIGAGAVVVKSIDKPGIYIGIPAKSMPN